MGVKGELLNEEEKKSISLYCTGSESEIAINAKGSVSVRPSNCSSHGPIPCVPPFMKGEHAN